LKLDSQIIKQGGESTGNHLQLLRDSFGRAVRLEVMFRASEHGFSAAAFHAKCDDIEDTLTLVRTEFGRTLAGYSHYK
jgi:lipopolysaccharide biosynthesis regulator YciM